MQEAFLNEKILATLFIVESLDCNVQEKEKDYFYATMGTCVILWVEILC